jgi:hypothetical protein
MKEVLLMPTGKGKQLIWIVQILRFACLQVAACQQCAPNLLFFVPIIINLSLIISTLE